MAPDLVIAATIEAIFRAEHRRVLATVVRLINDFDLAEDAVQEAFLAAAHQWPQEGIPVHPDAWLVSSARFKAIDHLRRISKLREMSPDLVRRVETLAADHLDVTEQDIKDDHLRLILTCCHPALDLQVQTALTLREVCGLTTEAIAAAFLVPPATMAQRIVRGKAKIRDAGIPFLIPGADELPLRIEAVLAVCYLVFNEGYSASSGTSHTRADLSGEAIRLSRLVSELCPDAEVFGLLALMLLHESRREARKMLVRALAAEPIGGYTIQAAISAVNASAVTAATTEWTQIVAWYDVLVQVAPSPVVKLNRAVAIAMRDGPEAGLKHLKPLQGPLAEYHLFHAARGELLSRAGRRTEAAVAYRRALSLVQQEPEHRFLMRRLREFD